MIISIFAKYYKNPIGVGNRLVYTLVNNDEEGKYLEIYFNSKLIHFMINITQYVEGQMAANEFKILRMIQKPGKPLKTDQEIYEYYNSSRWEIYKISRSKAKVVINRPGWKFNDCFFNRGLELIKS